ncbi:23909_t:CDS:1, partial [Gigaspora rosea]
MQKKRKPKILDLVDKLQDSTIVRLNLPSESNILLVMLIQDVH